MSIGKNKKEKEIRQIILREKAKNTYQGANRIIDMCLDMCHDIRNSIMCQKG